MSLRLTSLALLVFALFSTAVSAQDMLPPSWVYSSYFGGTGQDTITAQTIDSSGNVYVTGTTTSSDFPTTTGVYEQTYPGPSGDNAIFVSKFSPSGALLWSTFLGPGCYTFVDPSSIALDSSQNVYVAGIFECNGFPVTVGLPRDGSVFLSKLSSNGSELTYSTTLGGNSILGGPSVVVDTKGDAFLTGSGGGCCNARTGIIGPLGGISDYWVAEINSAGTSIPWSVQIGGTDDDEAYSMAIDSANQLYLTGYTESSDYPTTPGALDQPGTTHAFVTKLNPAQPPASSLVYSALAGNPGNTVDDFLQGTSIAVDPSDNAYVSTWSYNFGLFVSPHAFEKLAANVPNGYVFELNPAGSAIVNGTYVGGGNVDDIRAITVDNSGNTYVTGFTTSPNFPTTAYGNPLQAPNFEPGFYVKLNPQFAAVSSVEFGLQGAAANALVPDMAQGLWVSGSAQAQLFTTPNAFQPQYNGDTDGYLLHTNFAGICSTTSVAICSIAADPTSSERIHVTSQAANFEGATNIALNLDGLLVYNINAAQFDTWLPVAPGNHIATVVARNVAGKPAETQQSFSVASSSACPLNPAIPSITVCSPLNAASLSGSVNVVIEANGAPPPSTVTLIVDDVVVAKLENQNGSYTYTLTGLASGPHKLAVHGTDTNPEYLYASAAFQVE